MAVYYNNVVLDHFHSPRNWGELAPADGLGIAEIADRSIAIKFTLQIVDGVIVDIRFKTLGCVTSIASASMTTEIVKGMPVEAAWHLTEDGLSRALGHLPEEKLYCSQLAISALRTALHDFESKGGQPV